MFLKNYTSDVPVSQTVSRIETVLIRCGVSGIEKEYLPSGEVLAVTFRIKFSDDKQVSVRLPANVENAHQALWLAYANGDKISHDGNMLPFNNAKKKRRPDFRQQAERTAWKIIQDWVEVQMSMIQLNQAEFQQVFLPYIWDGSQTVYDKVKASGYAGLLSAPKGNADEN